MDRIQADMSLLEDTESSDLIAVGHVMIADYFVIHNVKVLKGDVPDKEYIRFPQELNSEMNEREDIFKFPPDIGRKIESAVFRDMLRKRKAAGLTLERTPEIRISVCEPHLWPVLAYATIKIKDMVEIEKIRIMDNGNGELKVQSPVMKNDNGDEGYIPFFSGITKEFDSQLMDIILDAYREEIK